MTQKVATNILDTFWQLADADLETRVRAAQALLLALKTAQAQSAQPEQIPCEELQYSLKRLVRGLASSREGARQGFATALAEVCLFSFFSIHQLIKVSQLRFFIVFQS
jgi:DNA polymerase phi